MDCEIPALFRGEFAVWSQRKRNVTDCIVSMFAVLLLQTRMGLKIYFTQWTHKKKPIKILGHSAELLGKPRVTSYNYVDVCTKFTYGKYAALYVCCLPV